MDKEGKEVEEGKEMGGRENGEGKGREEGWNEWGKHNIM